jgi:simple sugar transport system permease protein
MDQGAVVAPRIPFAQTRLGRVTVWTTRQLAVLLLAFGLSTLILILAKQNVAEAYRALYQGAFGDLWSISRTLRWTTPLLFTGLGAAVAFQAGMVNVGLDGQLYLGAVAATWIAITFTGLPKFLLVPLAFLAAALAGAVWASLAGWMKVRHNANEVVTTLMMNYIAILFTDYLVRYPLHAEGTAGESVATVSIASQARLATIIPGTQVSTGLIYGLLAVALVYYFSTRTAPGYELKIIGANPRFALSSGVPVARRQVQVMALSGLLAGLGGAIEILGVQGRFITRFANGLGFDGVSAALLAQNNPIGVLVGALFMGAIKSGGLALEMFSDVPRAMVTVLMGIVILTVTFQGGFQLFRRRTGGRA